MNTAGSLLQEDFTLIDSSYAPITGATLGAEFSIPISQGPDGQDFSSSIALIELGSGMYRVTFQTAPTSPAGHYSLQLKYTGTGTRLFEIEWDLAAAPITSVITTITTGNGVTRKALRRGVYALLGDMVLLQATQDSGDSVFVDVDNIVLGAGSYASRQLHITGGTVANLGQVRRISGSDGSNGLQLARSLPAPVMTGDEAELVNTYGQGFRIEQVHAAIAEVVATIKPRVSISYAVPDTFLSTQRELAIPAEFATIDRVEYRVPTCDTASWTQVQRAQAFGENGWSVDSAQRLIYIGGAAGHALYGASLRLVGMQNVTIPDNDTDLIPIDREWVRYRVAGELLTRALGQDASIAGDRMRIGLTYLDEAEKLRPKTVQRPRAGRTVLV